MHFYLLHVSDEACVEKRFFESSTFILITITGKKLFAHIHTIIIRIYSLLRLFGKNEEVRTTSDSSLGKITPVSPPLHWKESVSCSCLHQWHFKPDDKSCHRFVDLDLRSVIFKCVWLYSPR